MKQTRLKGAAGFLVLYCIEMINCWEKLYENRLYLRNHVFAYRSMQKSLAGQAGRNLHVPM